MDRGAGLTLLELLVTVAVVGLLASISIEVYAEALERSRFTRAVAEIRTIEKLILDFESEGELPESLADVGWDGHIDPWGNPYVSFKVEFNKNGKVKVASVRKDRFLVPLNSTYDLYSAGPDGRSALPLTAKYSRDDIIRAGDGSFIGPASDH